jgi:hypothetical protein
MFTSNKEITRALADQIVSDPITSSTKLNEFYKIVFEEYKPKKEELKIKILDFIDRKILTNVKKILKAGAELKGAREHHLIMKYPELKLKRSKWARKRGHLFENIVRDELNSYFNKNYINAICIKNQTNKFAFQPYDLYVLSRDFCTILIECKASGIKILNNEKVVLEPCTRRYAHFYKNLTKIRNLILPLKLPYFFCLRQKTTKQCYLVNASLIIENLPYLFTKRLILEPNEYLKISNTEPLDLIQDIFKLTEFKRTTHL